MSEVTPIKKAKPRKKTAIRQLAPGERPPEGVKPARYPASHGYVRLRWRVGPCEYVECYEHRAVMGFPEPPLQVHHRNGIRHDNRAENLEIVTPEEHGVHHRTIDRHEAKRLYAEGLSIPEVARRLGANNATVFRLLVAEDVEIRPGNSYLFVHGYEDVIEKLHTAGVRERRIAEAIGMSPTYVRRVCHDLGLPARRGGRPTDAELESAERMLAKLGLAG